ncbi:MAG: DUF2062 domain-containing protein [Rhodospirillaceae bacterium]|nr:DUF2062 domain-containing protein [Rhodospirillaceae bacterium]
MRKLKRQYFRRVLRPISRMELSPRHVANTMCVGLGVGLIAPPGIQLAVVGVVWAVGRFIGLRFNIAVAAVLTLITNPFTFVPIYTMYFAIGCTLTACGAGDFQVESLLQTFQDEGMMALLEQSGYFMLVILAGGLPFAVSGGIFGYYFGRSVGRRLQRRREDRMERRQAAPSPPTPD